MNYQNFKDLQEAYLGVFYPERLDEISQTTATRAYANRARRALELETIDDEESSKDYRKADASLGRIVRKFGPLAGKHAERAAEVQTSGRPRSKVGKRNFAKSNPNLKKEQVDLYDTILSHLLYEGYAETPEAAELIMVNMSEEWIQSIIG